MYYQIPNRTEEIVALSQYPVDEEVIATAIAGVISIARAQGQSLEDIVRELLEEDTLLSSHQRNQLSLVITQAWQEI